MTAPVEDGWIEWTGGENPVPGQTVEVMLRAGLGAVPARLSDEFGVEWTHEDEMDDTIAYRVVTPARAEAAAVSRDVSVEAG